MRFFLVTGGRGSGAVGGTALHQAFTVVKSYPVADRAEDKGMDFLQHANLSDPGAEEALYDMHSMREFAGLDLAHDAVPDEIRPFLISATCLNRHNLTEVLFEAVSSYLQEQSLLMRGGTIMDATLIAASPSTKNKTNKRDPDMSQTKKGNQWYFGMKAHIGVDAKSGLVHTIKTTTAKVHDARMTDDLIRTDVMRWCSATRAMSATNASAPRGPMAVLWAVKDRR